MAEATDPTAPARQEAYRHSRVRALAGLMRKQQCARSRHGEIHAATYKHRDGGYDLEA